MYTNVAMYTTSNKSFQEIRISTTQAESVPEKGSLWSRHFLNIASGGRKKGSG